MRIEKYLGYTIIITDIVRDWSKIAVEYKVLGTDIINECEYTNAINNARKEIDDLIINLD